MQPPRRPQLLLLPIFALALAGVSVLLAERASAYPDGISGYSGNPLTNRGASCSTCHTGGLAPLVLLEGPTRVGVGETASYTLTVSGGQRVSGGFNVSVTAGVLLSTSSDTKTLAGPVPTLPAELTQRSPKVVGAGGAVSWSFAWTAPGAPGEVTLYGAGLSANNGQGEDGDADSTDRLSISVVEAADADGDGVPDESDNCVEVPNPDQEDIDFAEDDDTSLPGIQHYGDACDADLDNDGIVAATDFFGVFRPCLGRDPVGGCAKADLDGDGVVGATDFFGILRPALGTAPGPGVTVEVPVPSLVGLDPSKPMILPITVQAAYNDDTMFFHIGWEGDRGDTHDYVRFTGGAWRQEGFPRREAQSTLDNDPARGPTNRTSTIYESRVTFILDNPSGPNAVADFGGFGCFQTCHDDSRAMPTWDPSKNLTKYLNDDTPGTLDLWHHRLARANPIGASDDQHVTRIPPGGQEGGRFGDQGESPWQVNNIVGGVPSYAFDPATTGGVFAFKFEDLFASPLRFFRRADAAERGAGPVAVGINFAEALARGYVPEEGDTIPRRRLRQPTGSRGDISALGTTYVPSTGDLLFGRIGSNTQRLLNTGNPDDTALADGGLYNVAFAVHTGMVTVRDHYVGFPMTLSLGGGPADIEAVKLAGSGRGALPDFSDTGRFPVTNVNLFLPGIASLEFLKGENVGLEYIDPATGTAVDQRHGGANGMLTRGLGCRDCHTASTADAFDPPQPGGFFAGAMETLIPQRGGVNTPTPIPPSGG